MVQNIQGDMQIPDLIVDDSGGGKVKDGLSYSGQAGVRVLLFDDKVRIIEDTFSGQLNARSGAVVGTFVYAK